MPRLPALLLLALGTGLLAVLPSPARAAESPGVYDVQLDRTMYPSSGSMTATWRFVAPDGTTASSDATCSIVIGGVKQSSSACRSGEAFSYDVGSVGYTTDAVVTVHAHSSDLTLVYFYDASQATAFDTVAPNGAVTRFVAANGFDAPTPMPPDTSYQAVLHANDNTSVTSAHCSLERVSAPAGVVASPLCPSVLVPGAQNFFTTPSSSGDYLYVLVVGDPAGNTTRVTRPFTVDATPPSAALVSGPPDGSTTNAPHPTWSWTTDDPDATFTCTVHAIGAAATAGPCTSPFTSDVVLTDGTEYAFELTGSDALGNTATTTAMFGYDSTAPSMGIANGPADGGTVTTTHVSYTFFSTEPVTYQCWWGRPGDPITYTPCTSGQTLTLPGNGTYALAFRATDEAGNVSPAILRSVAVAVPAPDRTPPRITVVGRPKSRVHLARHHRTVPVTIVLRLSEPCTVRYRLDGGAWRTGARRFTVKVGKGRHVLRISGVDAARNTSTTTVVRWQVLRAR